MLWCVFKPSSNTLPVSPYREVSPLWPSRGRLKCTSNSSSTWGKPTARSSTSPSRRRPEGNGSPEGRDGRANHAHLREGWGGGRTWTAETDSHRNHLSHLTARVTPAADARNGDPPPPQSLIVLKTFTSYIRWIRIVETTHIDTHLIYYAVTVGWMCFSNHMTNTFCKLTVF